MNQSLHSLLKSAGLSVPLGLSNPSIEMVSCDSRRVVNGSLFVGLPGEKVDGGCFWPEALSAGAVAAVIGEVAAKVHPPCSGDPVIVVSGPVGLWAGELAAAFWQQPSSKLALLGVTGTNGKTTTAYLIEYLSSALGSSTALFGTLVNRWPTYEATATHTTDFADGLQAKLASAVQSGAELCAMEVSSHALHQQRVSGCRFAGCVFTNLTQDHLDYHKSMEAYFEAKTLLFRAPLLIPGSDRAVVNVDDSWGAMLAERLGGICWRSSLKADALASGRAELTITDLELSPGGVHGCLRSPAGQGRFISPLIGRFNLMNLLQAVGVLLQQGFPLPKLLAAISGFTGVPGRMERVLVGEVEKSSQLPTVLVDYAHTPDGLENALIASRSLTQGRLVCVFGCGGDRDRGKRSKMGAIAAELSDRIVLTSDNPRTENPQQILNDVLIGVPRFTDITVETDRALAIAVAIADTDPTDVVLIAGKGHEDYQILGSSKVHFDDREEALRALRKRLTR